MARNAAAANVARRLPPASSKSRVLPYQRLKAAILSGELSPGQAMVETAMAAWCGVSRTPIREAFQRLQQDGLIHHKNGALVVRERSPEDILDLYETRIVLEATAARIAAERRSEHDIGLLWVLCDQCDTVPTTDTRGMVAVNRSFHQAVWKASRNESLIDALERLNMHLINYPETTLSAPGRWDTACEEHREVVSAIERRDTAAAHSLAAKHFTEARDIRLRLFSRESAQ